LWFNPAVGITLRQFEQLQQRATRRAAPALEPALPAPRMHSIVLGIDPSLRGSGFGVIRVEKRHALVLGHGTVHCPAGWERSRCLLQIARAMREQIAKLKPTVCVVEGLFYAQNFQTALIMGEARGASLVAAAEAGLEIFEIAPRKVKQAIVGYGAAQKHAVGKMVQRMLNLPQAPEADAADALALALAYVQSTSRYNFDPAKRI
jgi:crossover junction endodeoxyribonuclease RuvC